VNQPFESCPRFEGCSCNVCPLDPLAALHGGPRLALAGEEPCRVSRDARERVAVAHGYPPAWGWLPKEQRREKRRAAWAALPPEERVRRADAARAALQKAEETRLRGQRGAILRGVGEGDSPPVASEQGVAAPGAGIPLSGAGSGSPGGPPREAQAAAHGAEERERVG
jgi:hypothetical protein